MKLLLLFLCCANAHAQARLSPLPPAKFKSLQPTLASDRLPLGAGSLQLEPLQAFTIESPGSPPLSLVPARYSPEDGSGDVACGLFFAIPNEPTRFLRTYNLFPDSWGRCGSTAAVGLMSDPGPRPRLILIYNAFSPPRHSWQQAVVLQWDASKSTYLFDQSLPAPEGVVGVGKFSVAQVRRKLAASAPLAHKP